MRHEVIPLEVPAADGTGGEARSVTELVSAAVCAHASAPFVVDMKVQGKVSGSRDTNSDWFDLASGAITNAAVLVPIPNGVTHVRVFRTSVTSGLAGLRVSVSGKEARTDVPS